MNRGTLTFIANQGQIGGGEVMLLNMAQAALECGIRPVLLCPAEPSELCDLATSTGMNVVALPGSTRILYLLRVRWWTLARRSSTYWCVGLGPSLALTGIRRRVVHLHQLPRGWQRAAYALSRAGAAMVLVPSRFMQHSLPDAVVLHNWTAQIDRAPRRQGGRRVGFIGRLTPAKGALTLLNAWPHLRAALGPDAELHLAGTSKFASTEDARKVDLAVAAAGPGVVRHGWTDAQAFLREVDVLVIPSLFPEAFGLVVSESMAAGLPFVVSDAGALPEVAGGEFPYVFRAGDAADLCSAVLAALSDDGATWSRARKRWEEEFAPIAGVRRFQEIVKALRLDREGA